MHVGNGINRRERDVDKIMLWEFVEFNFLSSSCQIIDSVG